MANDGSPQREAFPRGQVVAVVLLVAALAVTLYLARHRGRPSEVSLTPGDSAAYAFRVDINHASWEEIALLPGLGPAKARAIVAYREEHGPFKSASDLLAVPGIGEKTVSGITPGITFEAK